MPAAPTVPTAGTGPAAQTRPGAQTEPGVLDLVGTVRQQHRAILELTDRMLERYESSPISHYSAVRAADALVAAESRHEVAEAVFLWPVVRDLLPELAGLRASAQAQEREARRLLLGLHRSAAGEQAAAVAAEVGKALSLHVRFEETQFLAPLAVALDLRDSYRLARLFSDLSRRGPSRPHPRVPDIPGLLRSGAPVVARADRVRDFLRMR